MRALAALVLLAAASAATAQEVYVDIVCGSDISPETRGARDKPFKTMLEAANWGTELIALPNRGGEPYPYFSAPKDLTVRAEGGPLQTLSRGFGVPDLKTVTIRGFTVSSVGTAGIYVGYDTNVTIRNCVVCHCQGNGIHARKDCDWQNLSIVNCVIFGNDGHGIYYESRGDCCGFWSNSAEFNGDVSNCIIKENVGSGIYWYAQFREEDGCSGNLRIRYSWIDDNHGGSQLYNPSKYVSVLFPLSGCWAFRDPENNDFRLREDPGCAAFFHAGDPSVLEKNPDGTRNTPGAFGGPGSAGFYPYPIDPPGSAAMGPQVELISIEPVPNGGGKVTIRVVARPAQ